VVVISPPVRLSRLIYEKAHPVVPYTVYTNLDLNAFMLEASTVHWSSKLHKLITLFEKKYWVISPVHRVLTSLRECFLVPLLYSSSLKSSRSKTLCWRLYRTHSLCCVMDCSIRCVSCSHYHFCSTERSCSDWLTAVETDCSPLLQSNVGAALPGIW